MRRHAQGCGSAAASWEGGGWLLTYAACIVTSCCVAVSQALFGGAILSLPALRVCSISEHSLQQMQQPSSNVLKSSGSSRGCVGSLGSWSARLSRSEAGPSKGRLVVLKQGGSRCPWSPEANCRPGGDTGRSAPRPKLPPWRLAAVRGRSPPAAHVSAV